MKRIVFRTSAAFLSALVPTVLVYFILGTEGGLWFLIIFAVSGIALSFGCYYTKKFFRRMLSTFRLLLYLIGAGVIAIGLNLTPSSAYLAWFRIAQDGKASEIILLDSFDSQRNLTEMPN